jgi:hypothetical protein
MNRSLPARDRRHRSSDPCRASGPGGFVSGPVRLGGRAAAFGPGTGRKAERARRGKSRAGQSWAMRISAAQGVDALAVLALSRVDLEALLLAQGAANESADTVLLMPMSA